MKLRCPSSVIHFHLGQLCGRSLAIQRGVRGSFLLMAVAVAAATEDS